MAFLVFVFFSDIIIFFEFIEVFILLVYEFKEGKG